MKAQFDIELKDGSVICHCDPSQTELLVFRGQNPIKGTELYGRYTKDSTKVIFTPIIPFMLSGNYMAVCGRSIRTWTVPIPEDYEYGDLKAIYPTSSNLPANLLKFNIQFSKPMSVIAYENIFLVDADGRKVHRALLSEIPELWNDDHSMLTLWIEPGRIKRGLGPSERLGPVLELGKKYSLVISPDIRDGLGVKMAGVFNKDFVVVEADREKPNIENWKVEQVMVDNKIGIRIDFDEPMDVASTTDGFYIPGQEGSWSMLHGERSILFVGNRSLEAGTYTLEVASIVEDLAGNNLNRLFDQELGDESAEQNNSYQLKFVVK